MTADPRSSDWTPGQVQVMQRLRDWTVGFTELNQHLAAWMHLPSTDANALGQIIWADEADAPLSPAQLGRQIGMTSGATTVLLNRLEVAGHLYRTREHSDRRRVTLRPVPAARERAHAFLVLAGTEIAATLHAADPDDLATVIVFLERITAAATEASRRLGS